MINTVLLMAVMSGAGYFNNPRFTDYEGLSMNEWYAISESFDRIGVDGTKVDDFGNKFYYEYESIDFSTVTVEMMPPHCDNNWVYHEEIYSHGNKGIVVVFMTDGKGHSRARVLE